MHFSTSEGAEGMFGVKLETSCYVLYYITVVPNLFPFPMPPLSKLMTPHELTYFMDISCYIDCITKTVQNNQELYN